MVRRVRIGVVLSLLGLALASPEAARAAPPVCPGATLQTPTNTPLNLPAPQCTGVLPDATVQIVPASGPANGTIIPGNPNVYRPNTVFQGYDSFRYTVTNPGEAPSNEATVTILVDAAPSCTNGTATVAMNGQVVLDALPCSDPDGAQDYFIWATDGARGRVDFLDDRVVTYTPSRDFVGTDTFVISAEDRFGLESQDATITVTVIGPPVTPLPTAVPTVAPPPRDTTPATVTLKSPAKQLKQVLSKGVAIELGTNENASATLTLTLDKATARKLKLSGNVGTLKAALTPGKATLAVKLSAKARKALKTAKRIKLTVTAVVTDTAGNKTTKTLTVTLKR
jgi:hypothetical protein